uniref:Uncharacterized protein n=1 Tax=Romanomermis culicivorax TaxID=13658 RepID=A0A915KRY4_ROMCU
MAIDIGALSITTQSSDEDELSMGAFLTSNGCIIDGAMGSKLNQFAYMAENAAELEINHSQTNISIGALYDKVFSQIA